jgi:hypothetical protein
VRFIIGCFQFLGALTLIALVLAFVFGVIMLAWTIRAILIVIGVIALLMYVIKEVFTSRKTKA